MVYAMQEAGITDPVGELQKSREFGITNVSARPAREKSSTDAITEANKISESNFAEFILLFLSVLVPFKIAE